jgi:hypothetical protein
MKRIIISIAIVLVIAAAGITVWTVSHRSDEIKYNTGYVNGNTAGNLYNAGLFCESNGTVFFANPDDNNRLYSMDADGTNLKKLCNDSAMYINADSNYVYFIKNNSNSSTSSTAYAIDALYSYSSNALCRIDREGGRVTVLDSDPCLYASLIGNEIYYLHYDSETATTLYKIGIDGESRTKVANNYVFTCSTDGQYFYYDNSADGSIYRYDTVTDTTSQVYACNCYKPIVTNDGNAYYMDINQDNALVHVDINTGNPVTLSSESLDLYNVYGSTIYYQTYSKTGSSLCMIKNDGTGYQVLAEGAYSSINATSYYIYFVDYRTGQMYYTPTSNPGTLYAFHPGVVE